MSFSPARVGSEANARPTGRIRPGTRRGFRVLAIAPTYFFGDTGCHVRILEEALTLRQLGSETVICTYPGGRNVGGLRIEHALPMPLPAGNRVGSSRRKPFLDALLLLTCLRVSAGFRPDVIHAHIHEGALIGYPLSKLLNVPLVFDFQGSMTSEMIDHEFLSRTSRLYRPFRGLERWINHHNDVIVTSTLHGASVLADQFGVPPSRIRPLEDAVSVDTFAPRWTYPRERVDSLRRALGIPDERKVVVFLGLLAEYQGVTHLIEAAAQVVERLPSTHFLLMGWPGQERYRALADRIGIGDHVTFTGRLPYERAPEHLAIGDLAVAPKLSKTEGNGKLLNYMAVGLPIVAFDAPVNRQILGDIGSYAAFGDVDDLARAMVDLLSDPAQAEEMGRALRESVAERFSWPKASVELLDIYESLLKNR